MLDRPLVIWGLRKTWHSHRYIHAGWYRTLKAAGFEVQWVDDEPSAEAAIRPGSTIIAVNVASDHLPIRPDCKYVVHNFDLREKVSADHRVPSQLHLQVWTNNVVSAVNFDGLPCVTYDDSSQTLFQPWGTPFEEGTWISEPIRRTKVEFWIGSIWNNQQNQGNAAAISDWRKALAASGIHFLKAPKGWPDTARLYGGLVRMSAVGAAIVGSWQAEVEYLPCRVFKNLSFGALPVGNNLGYQRIFGDYAIAGVELSEVVDQALSRKVAPAQVRECQNILRAYTHLASLKRMFSVLENL